MLKETQYPFNVESQLESLVNEYSLADVLAILADICMKNRMENKSLPQAANQWYDDALKLIQHSVKTNN